MKVFQDFISKLDSIEKHESNFGNLCIKKDGSFQKERFLFLLKFSMTLEAPPPPCVRHWNRLSKMGAGGRGERLVSRVGDRCPKKQRNNRYSIVHQKVRK